MMSPDLIFLVSTSASSVLIPFSVPTWSVMETSTQSENNLLPNSQKPKVFTLRLCVYY